MSYSVDGPVVVLTALGYVGFDLVDGRDRLSNVRHHIDVFAIFPELARGKSVASAVTVLLTVAPTTSTKRLHFRCRWMTPPVGQCGIDPAENLESQYWEGDGRLVHIGTEDIDVVERRLPYGRFLGAPPPRYTDHPTYVTDGMNVTVPYVGRGTTITLHYIVAEPLPEPVEYSTSYAVDLGHRWVVAQRPSSGIRRRLGDLPAVQRAC